jgi:uncharacterized OB-fold protein
LLHLLSSPDWATVRTGQRVRPVWNEERIGSILDIRHFEVVAAEVS